MHINRWFLYSSLFLYCQLFSYRFIRATKHNTESFYFEMEINAVFAAVALRHNDDLSDSEQFIIRDDIVCLFAITGESQTIKSVTMGRGKHFTDFFFFLPFNQINSGNNNLPVRGTIEKRFKKTFQLLIDAFDNEGVLECMLTVVFFLLTKNAAIFFFLLYFDTYLL